MKKRPYVRCCGLRSDEESAHIAVVDVPSTFGDSVQSVRVIADSVLVRDGVAYAPVSHLGSDSIGDGKREVLFEFVSAIGPQCAIWVHEDLAIEVES